MLWMNSFTQQIFLEHLLYARHYSRHWRYSSDHETKSLNQSSRVRP